MINKILFLFIFFISSANIFSESNNKLERQDFDLLAAMDKYDEHANYYHLKESLPKIHEFLINSAVVKNLEADRESPVALLDLEEKHRCSKIYKNQFFGDYGWHKKLPIAQKVDSLRKTADDLQKKSLIQEIAQEGQKIESDLKKSIMTADLSFIQKDYNNPLSPVFYLDDYQLEAGRVLDQNLILYSSELRFFHNPSSKCLDVKDKKQLTTLSDLRFYKGSGEESPKYCLVEVPKKFMKFAGAKAAVMRKMAVITTDIQAVKKDQEKIRSFVAHPDLVKATEKLEAQLQKYEIDFLNSLKLKRKAPSWGEKAVPSILSSKAERSYFYWDTDKESVVTNVLEGLDGMLDLHGKISSSLSGENSAASKGGFSERILNHESMLMLKPLNKIILSDLRPLLNFFHKIYVLFSGGLSEDVKEIVDTALDFAGFKADETSDKILRSITLLFKYRKEMRYEEARTELKTLLLNMCDIEARRKFIDLVKTIDAATHPLDFIKTNVLFIDEFKGIRDTYRNSNSGLIGSVAGIVRSGKKAKALVDKPKKVAHLIEEAQDFYYMVKYDTVSNLAKHYGKKYAKYFIPAGFKSLKDLQESFFSFPRELSHNKMKFNRMIEVYKKSYDNLIGLSHFFNNSRRLTKLCKKFPDFSKKLNFFRFLEEFDLMYRDDYKPSAYSYAKSLRKFEVELAAKLAYIKRFLDLGEKKFERNGSSKDFKSFNLMKGLHAKIENILVTVRAQREFSNFKYLPEFLKELNHSMFRKQKASFFQKGSLGLEEIARVAKLTRQLPDFMPHFTLMYQGICELLMYPGFARMLSSAGSNGKNKYCIPNTVDQEGFTPLCAKQFWNPLTVIPFPARQDYPDLSEEQFAEKCRQFYAGIIPSDIMLGAEGSLFTQMYLTGRNAEGKSNLMRAIAYLFLFNQTIGIVCSEVVISIAVIDYICSMKKQAEKGDDGFSSHKGQVSALRTDVIDPVFIKRLYKHPLLLLDELFNGASEKEGQAGVKMVFEEVESLLQDYAIAALAIVASHCAIHPRLLPRSCYLGQIARTRTLVDGVCDVKDIENSATAELMQDFSFPEEYIYKFKRNRQIVDAA